MIEGPLEAVRELASGGRALADLVAISGHHRIQSSPGYDRAAEWVAAAAERAGLEVAIERVPADGHGRRLGVLQPEGWACDEAWAVLHGEGAPERVCDYSSCKLSLVQRSDPVEGRFPLAALEDGSEERHYEGRDVRGRVILTSGPVQRVHALAVTARGAAGLLCDGRRLLPPVREAGDERDAVAYTSFWWCGDEPRGWGFAVSPATADRLRARLARGERLELEVRVRTRRYPTAVPLVSARLPGGDPDGEELLLLAHLCHPEPGANDNASGAAALLETARVLAALRARGALPERGPALRFLWMPELTGTCAWFGGDPERARRTLAGLNLDMVGEDQSQCGSTLLVERPPAFAASFAEELLCAVRARAQEWVTSFSGPGHFGTARLGEVPYSGGSDHAVLLDPSVGAPCPMLVQWPDRFYHSSHDTPERSDPASLALAVRSAAAWAAVLADTRPDVRRGMGALTARAARRRLLAALDGPDPERGAARERRRGAAAIASLARLGLPRADVERAGDAFARFAETEAGPAAAPRPPAREPRLARVPRRAVHGPLDFHRHLVPGWERLSPAAREELRAFDAALEGPVPVTGIAWMACDGRRTVGEIADEVRLEGGPDDPGVVARWFDWTDALGLTSPEPGRAS